MPAAMDYRRTTEWLFTQTPVFQRVGAAAYKPGLDTVSALSAAFGSPHAALRCIHIAGTNGKGSTAHMIAAICQSAGLRTGLFTSPHLLDFRERIRVDGAMISEREVVDFVARYRAASLGLEPSFFELTTVMAFDHFRRSAVDVAVIETGLGGRLDSTNIITPLVSVITNISPDHTALLGSTPAAIAAEKAGIIKPGIPVVIGEASDPDVRRVFETTAAALRAPLTYAPALRAEPDPRGGWYYPDLHARGALEGDFQPRNVSAAIEALRVSSLPIGEEAIAAGLSGVETLTGLRGRLTTLQTAPVRIVYDTGHNPGAWAYIGPYLAAVRGPLTVVVGFAADKDVESILRMMPRSARYIFTCPDCPRGLPADSLLAMARRTGLDGTAVPAVAPAMERARAVTPAGGTIFVGGSNFVIADLLRSLS